VESEKDADRSPEVAIEALKVVINLVTKVEQDRALFVQKHHAELGVIKVLQNPETQKSLDLLFLLYRLLAQVTINEDNTAIVRSIGDSEVMHLCVRDITTITVFDANRVEVAVFPPFVHEAFTTLFNITLHLGRLKGNRTTPTPTECQLFSTVSKTMDEILQTRSEQHTLLRQAVASCLLNSPEGWSKLVDHDGLLRAVRFFLEVVRENVGKSHFQFHAESVIPHLMLLAAIMEENIEIRPIVLDTIFPADYISKTGEICIEGPDVLRVSGCIGAKLAHHMTSPSVAAKHFVQEFLYQACGEDAKLLCRLVGVGNAAGLLQEKGLLGNFVQFFRRSVNV